LSRRVGLSEGANPIQVTLASREPSIPRWGDHGIERCHTEFNLELPRTILGGAFPLYLIIDRRISGEVELARPKRVDGDHAHQLPAVSRRLTERADVSSRYG